MTSTHTVIESQKHLSNAHVGQAAVVGRHDTGEVHLRMTPDAAQVLAGVLAQYAAPKAHLAERYDVADHDPDMWNHVAVDLRAAKAMAGSLSPVGDQVAPVSGYLPPRSAKGAATAVVVSVPVAFGRSATPPASITDADLAATLKAAQR